MPRLTVPILKFVGTVSLGLLTGISYSQTHLIAPLLLTLPSASSAQSQLTHLRRTTSIHTNALLVLSISSYTLAYALSPRKGGQHPYLLWTSLLAAISYGTGFYLDYTYDKQARQNGSKEGRVEMSDDDYVDATHSTANIMTPTSGSDAGSDGEAGKDGVNGEQVRVGIERFGFVEGVKEGVTGAAFLMGVVGIWGDGVGMGRA